MQTSVNRGLQGVGSVGYEVPSVGYAIYWVFERCEGSDKSLLERGTGVGHRKSGIHASTNTYMAVALEWKGYVMNMCKRCRLESTI